MSSFFRSTPSDTEIARRLQAHIEPLPNDKQNYTSILKMTERARFALLGEASHGTHEFYQHRADITRRLITEQGVTAVAVEADWPDAWRVNRYVRGLPGDADAHAALSGFKRFPAWLWRNTVVLEFVEWLRTFNHGLQPAKQVGFYGLDLYSLYDSMKAVLDYLHQTDVQAARHAYRRYGCFDRVAADSQAYGYKAYFGLQPVCEAEVVEQLHEMNQLADVSSAEPGLTRDELFCAQQNARVVCNAEAYYRVMQRGRVSSWNLRDSHMAQTLQALDQHLARSGTSPPRFAVWAHNSHLGDASATEMAFRGEWNLGQLVREHYPGEAMLLGFSTHHGHVSAASGWDQAPEHKRVVAGLPGSWEDVLHQTAGQTGQGNFLLPLTPHADHAELCKLTQAERLQRAIGVIYRPEAERQSHYFFTTLADQFDALLHLDSTSALRPLDEGWVASGEEVPETYPSGI
jgi:erythromycin esterase-like protein